MEGKWISKPKSKTVIIWVHGVLSSGENCWKNDNNNYWPQMIAEEISIGDSGNYVFTYHTSIFSKDYSISDIVDSLKEYLKLDGILNYSNLIFVCHSMGGIVVRKYLVDRATDLIEKNIKIGLYLIASPSLGSGYADFFNPLAKFMGHSQADSLKFIENNNWLYELNKNFRNLKEGSKLIIRGKELVEDKFIILKSFIFFKQVVTPISGSIFFGEPIKIPKSDHFSIAKPKDNTELQHRLLVQFIEENCNHSEKDSETHSSDAQNAVGDNFSNISGSVIINRSNN